MKTFRGLNKTVRVPFPKPHTRPHDATTFPGSAPDNGKINNEETQPKAPAKPQPLPHKMDNSVKGLKRRMKNSQGISTLKPQAEEVVTEAKRKHTEYHEGETVRFSGQAADGSTSGDMDVKVVNPHSNKHKITHTDKSGRHYEGSHSHIPTATVERPARLGMSPAPARNFEAHHHTLSKKVTEAYIAPTTSGSSYAAALPVPAGTKKTNMEKKLKRSTLATGAQYENVINSFDDLAPIFEEFKVGEKDDVDGNNEAKKVRGTNAKGPGTGTVKRKYLGKTRGTTATGKPAHVIITEPVIGEKDKNWNKTTPSGDRKQ